MSQGMMQMAHQAQTKASAASQGLTYGLLQGTPVLTLDGELPVEFLEPGDRILTRAGSRRLKSVEVSIVRNARMMRVGASTLGRERPEEDLLLPASQPVLVRDWRAKALAGTAQAMIAVSKLADGEYIRGEIVAEARLFTLGFEEEVVIYAGGLELGCPMETVRA